MSHHTEAPPVDRDVLAALLRRAWTASADTAAEPGKAVDVFVEHLVPVLAAELHRRGFVCRPSETLVQRLRYAPYAGVVFGGAVVAGLIVALIWLVVMGLT